MRENLLLSNYEILGINEVLNDQHNECGGISG
jgi:hypothetical protein